jgi:hypothetical protein
MIFPACSRPDSMVAHLAKLSATASPSLSLTSLWIESLQAFKARRRCFICFANWLTALRRMRSPSAHLSSTCSGVSLLVRHMVNHCKANNLNLNSSKPRYLPLSSARSHCCYLQYHGGEYNRIPSVRYSDDIQSRRSSRVGPVFLLNLLMTGRAL